MVLNQYYFMPRFFRLAIANVISKLMVPLSGLISVAFLGHLNDIRHLAGVALATLLFNYVYQAMDFLRMGTTGLTAQAVGRDDREAMLLVGLRNGLIALGLGMTILIMQFPLRELGFALLSGAADVKASGLDYFDARIWGAPAFTINLVLIGWLLGCERGGIVVAMSVLGNVANIVLDYLFITRLGWNSAGAGLSQALSQYLTMLPGLIWIVREISLEELRAVAPQLRDLSAFRATFALNGDIFVRNLLIWLTYSLLTNIFATMGTIVLAKNALLIEVVMLSMYMLEGIAYAAETLTGNFHGKNAKEQFIPLLRVAGVSSLVVAFTISLAFALFPQTLFGLLTNHTEVTESINLYTPWLLPLLGLLGIAMLLDSYFLGFTEGHTLRNAALVSTGLGFIPTAILAWQFQSVHMLWLALSLFMATRVVMLGVQIPRTLKSDENESIVSTMVVNNEYAS